MRIIAFIEQLEVTEKILSHLGLWPAPAHSSPNPLQPSVGQRGLTERCRPFGSARPCPQAFAFPLDSRLQSAGY